MEGQQKIKRKEIYMAEVLPNKYKGIIVTHDMLQCDGRQFVYQSYCLGFESHRWHISWLPGIIRTTG
jgi:hypothetical protein